MSRMPIHYAGRRYFDISGLPFFAMRYPQPQHICHDHDFFEIALVLSGQAEHQIYGKKHTITREDILIIPPHQRHAYLNTENMEIINMFFDPVEFEKTAFDLPKSNGYQRLFAKKHDPLNVSAARFATLVGLLTGFISEIEAKRPGYKDMAAGLFIQAIGIIARAREHINTPPLLLSRIEQTLDFIETHYNEDITLDQLALLAHMSRSTFQRIFKKMTNTSPISYLVNLRIRKASSLLLARSDLNITEIALQVGFSDSNYFSRQFRKITGISPGVFKKQQVMRE